MILSIIIPFIVIAVIGLLLGFGLSIADKKLAVVKDEKLLQLESIMPGANCGGCGYAGCSGYADAVFEHKAAIGLCSPGGNETAQKMAEIMGEKVGEIEKKVAYVFCTAPISKVTKDFDYDGLSDCNAASILFKGNKTCKDGCLGFGSCMGVCPQNAIYRDEDSRIVVDRNLCIGCGKCEKICPNHVIRLIPVAQNFVVGCNSHEKGAVLRSYCEIGCIGCSICEKKFPSSGFKVNSFLAEFDSSLDHSQAEEALQACPRKIIHRT